MCRTQQSINLPQTVAKIGRSWIFYHLQLPLEHVAAGGHFELSHPVLQQNLVQPALQSIPGVPAHWIVKLKLQYISRFKFRNETQHETLAGTLVPTSGGGHQKSWIKSIDLTKYRLRYHGCFVDHHQISRRIAEQQAIRRDEFRLRRKVQQCGSGAPRISAYQDTPVFRQPLHQHAETATLAAPSLRANQRHARSTLIDPMLDALHTIGLLSGDTLHKLRCFQHR
jgi:hypothetical protein